MAQRPNAEVLDQAVEAIYAASLEPQQWSEAMALVAQAIGSRSASLITPSLPPEQGGFIHPFGIPSEMLSIWARDFVQKDPWVFGAVNKGLYVDGAILTSDDLIPRAELHRTEFYKEFLRSFDFEFFATSVVFGLQSPIGPPANVTLLNPRHDGDYDKDQLRLLGVLSRHVSRSLGTTLTLRDASLRIAIEEAALECSPTPMILLDRVGNVAFANMMARAVLEQQSGLLLRNEWRSGHLVERLHAGSQSEDEQLQQAIERAISRIASPNLHFKDGVKVSRSGAKRPLFVRVSSIVVSSALATAHGGIGAIAFVADPDSMAIVSSNDLVELFGLTISEANVAKAIASGDSIGAVAHGMNLSENTVKTHLANVYEKTRTHRQAELVRLMTTIAIQRGLR